MRPAAGIPLIVLAAGCGFLPSSLPDWVANRQPLAYDELPVHSIRDLSERLFGRRERHHDGGLVTLDRPNAMNALNATLLAELLDVVFFREAIAKHVFLSPGRMRHRHGPPPRGRGGGRR